jgi:hypothetical protein
MIAVSYYPMMKSCNFAYSWNEYKIVHIYLSIDFDRTSALWSLATAFIKVLLASSLLQGWAGRKKSMKGMARVMTTRCIRSMSAPQLALMKTIELKAMA